MCESGILVPRATRYKMVLRNKGLGMKIAGVALLPSCTYALCARVAFHPISLHAANPLVLLLQRTNFIVTGKLFLSLFFFVIYLLVAGARAPNGGYCQQSAYVILTLC